jgi:hypothetical protein
MTPEQRQRAVRLAQVARAHDEWEQRHLADARFAPQDARLDDYGLHYLDVDATGVQQSDYARRLTPASR